MPSRVRPVRRNSGAPRSRYFDQLSATDQRESMQRGWESIASGQNMRPGEEAYQAAQRLANERAERFFSPFAVRGGGQRASDTTDAAVRALRSARFRPGGSRRSSFFSRPLA